VLGRRCDDRPALGRREHGPTSHEGEEGLHEPVEGHPVADDRIGAEAEALAEQQLVLACGQHHHAAPRSDEGPDG
jgi:hypothetical protein